MRAIENRMYRVSAAAGQERGAAALTEIVPDGLAS